MRHSRPRIVAHALNLRRRPRSRRVLRHAANYLQIGTTGS
jgi:hypothetical protein